MTTIGSIVRFILVTGRNMNKNNSSLVSTYLWLSMILSKISWKVIFVDDIVHTFITLSYENYDLRWNHSQLVSIQVKIGPEYGYICVSLTEIVEQIRLVCFSNEKIINISLNFCFQLEQAGRRRFSRSIDERINIEFHYILGCIFNLWSKHDETTIAKTLKSNFTGIDDTAKGGLTQFWDVSTLILFALKDCKRS